MNEVPYTIGKFFAKSGCISQDMLMQYADGTLPEAQNRQVELHLADCTDCDEALEGIMLAGTENYAKMVEEVGKLVEQRISQDSSEGAKVIEFRPNINPPQAAAIPVATTTRGGFKKALPFFGIAASLALILTFGIFFMGDSGAKIADRNFEAMEIGTKRGAVLESPDPSDLSANPNAASEATYQEALDLYEAKNYQEAASKFDLSTQPKAALFAGDSYFLLENFTAAATRYQKVIDAKNGSEGHAEYNLALTYLKLDQVDKAKAILEAIAQNEEHDFVNKAKLTLQDVNDL